MGIDEQSFRGVHSPGFERAPGECEDLRIDEIPLHDGSTHGVLHCNGRGERRWLLYGHHRLRDCQRYGLEYGVRFVALPFSHRRYQQVYVAGECGRIEFGRLLPISFGIKRPQLC